MATFLVTGSFGQVGSDLIPQLCKKYGKSSVIATDKYLPHADMPCEMQVVDVTDYKSILDISRERGVDCIIHLASILSALGEKNNDLAFSVNFTGTYNVLKVARELSMKMVIIPSTIGVFGADTPRENVPAITLTRPASIYGISKVFAEQISSYFSKKYGIDVRGLRLPGLISYSMPPSNGTTDYAVDMIIHAAKHKQYTCYLKENATLPMMYMPDAIKAILDIMSADRERLRYNLEYNVQAFSFSPKDLENELQKYLPDFRVSYVPDYRQEIAETWPRSLDISESIEDWNFNPSYDFSGMVRDMYEHLSMGDMGNE